MSTLSLFVNKPCIESVEAAFPAILEAGQFTVHHVSLDEDLLRLIHEAKPCVCVFSQNDGVIRKEVLGILEKLKELRIASGRPLKDPVFRIVLVAFEPGIPTRNWGELGVHEIIVAPVLPRALAFKLSRHHQKAIAAYEIEKLAQADDTTPIQEFELQEQKPPSEWRSFVQNETKFTMIEEEDTRHKIKISLSGSPLPDPKRGEWSSNNPSNDVEKSWDWKPQSESSPAKKDDSKPSSQSFTQDPSTPQKTKWKFEGEKPTYDTSKKAWTFTGEKPLLQAELPENNDNLEPKFTDVILYHGKNVKVRAELEKDKPLQVHELKKQTFAIKKTETQDVNENTPETANATKSQPSIMKRAAQYLSNKNEATPKTKTEKQKNTPESKNKKNFKSQTETNQNAETTQKETPLAEKELEAQELEEFLEMNFDLGDIGEITTNEAPTPNTESQTETSSGGHAPDIQTNDTTTTTTNDPADKSADLSTDESNVAASLPDEVISTLDKLLPTDDSTTDAAPDTSTQEQSTQATTDPLSAASAAEPSIHTKNTAPSNENARSFSKEQKNEASTQSFSKTEKTKSPADIHSSTQNPYSPAQKDFFGKSKTNNDKGDASKFKSDDPKDSSPSLRSFSNEDKNKPGYEDKSDPNYKEHSTWSMGGLEDDLQKKSQKNRDADIKKILEAQKENLEALESEQTVANFDTTLESDTNQSKTNPKKTPPIRHENETDQDWLSRLAKFFRSLFK